MPAVKTSSNGENNNLSEITPCYVNLKKTKVKIGPKSKVRRESVEESDAVTTKVKIGPKSKVRRESVEESDAVTTKVKIGPKSKVRRESVEECDAVTQEVKHIANGRHSRRDSVSSVKSNRSVGSNKSTGSNKSIGSKKSIGSNRNSSADSTSSHSSSRTSNRKVSIRNGSVTNNGKNRNRSSSVTSGSSSGSSSRESTKSPSKKSTAKKSPIRSRSASVVSDASSRSSSTASTKVPLKKGSAKNKKGPNRSRSGSVSSSSSSSRASINEANEKNTVKKGPNRSRSGSLNSSRSSSRASINEANEKNTVKKGPNRSRSGSVSSSRSSSRASINEANEKNTLKKGPNRSRSGSLNSSRSSSSASINEANEKNTVKKGPNRSRSGSLNSSRSSSRASIKGPSKKGSAKKVASRSSSRASIKEANEKVTNKNGPNRSRSASVVSDTISRSSSRSSTKAPSEKGSAKKGASRSRSGSLNSSRSSSRASSKVTSKKDTAKKGPIRSRSGSFNSSRSSSRASTKAPSEKGSAKKGASRSRSGSLNSSRSSSRASSKAPSKKDTAKKSPSRSRSGSLNSSRSSSRSSTKAPSKKDTAKKGPIRSRSGSLNSSRSSSRASSKAPSKKDTAKKSPSTSCSGSLNSSRSSSRASSKAPSKKDTAKKSPSTSCSGSLNSSRSSSRASSKAPSKKDTAKKSPSRSRSGSLNSSRSSSRSSTKAPSKKDTAKKSPSRSRSGSLNSSRSSSRSSTKAPSKKDTAKKGPIRSRSGSLNSSRSSSRASSKAPSKKDTAKKSPSTSCSGSLNSSRSSSRASTKAPTKKDTAKKGPSRSRSTSLSSLKHDQPFKNIPITKNPISNETNRRNGPKIGPNCRPSSRRSLHDHSSREHSPEIQSTRSLRKRNNTSTLQGPSAPKRAALSLSVRKVKAEASKDLINQMKPFSIILHRIKVPEDKKENQPEVAPQPSTTGWTLPNKSGKTKFSKNQQQKKLIVTSNLWHKKTVATDSSDSEADKLDIVLSSNTSKAKESNSIIDKAPQLLDKGTEMVANPSNVDSSGAEKPTVKKTVIETFFERLQRERKERDKSMRISKENNSKVTDSSCGPKTSKDDQNIAHTSKSHDNLEARSSSNATSTSNTITPTTKAGSPKKSRRSNELDDSYGSDFDKFVENCDFDYTSSEDETSKIPKKLPTSSPKTPTTSDSSEYADNLHLKPTFVDADTAEFSKSSKKFPYTSKSSKDQSMESDKTSKGNVEDPESDYLDIDNNCQLGFSDDSSSPVPDNLLQMPERESDNGRNSKMSDVDDDIVEMCSNITKKITSNKVANINVKKKIGISKARSSKIGISKDGCRTNSKRKQTNDENTTKKQKYGSMDVGNNSEDDIVEIINVKNTQQTSKLKIDPRVTPCSVVLDRNQVSQYLQLRKNGLPLSAQNFEILMQNNIKVTLKIMTNPLLHSAMQTGANDQSGANAHSGANAQSGANTPREAYPPKVMCSSAGTESWGLKELLSSNCDGGNSDICEFCGTNFPAQEILRKHQAIVHKTEPFCIACSLYFDTETEFQEHQNVCVYALNIPDTRVVNSANSNVGKIRIASNLLQKDSVSSEKSNSVLQFMFMTSLNNTVNEIEDKSKQKQSKAINKKSKSTQVKNKISTKATEIPTENITVSDSESDIEIIDPKSEIYQCKKCSKKFKTVFNLRKHMAFVHKEEPGCKYCKLYMSEEVLVKHNKTCEQYLANQKSEAEKSNFSCTSCDATFNTKNQLMEHKKVHDFKCIKCDLPFPSFLLLETHHKMFHKSCRHLCFYCPRGLRTKALLQQHISEKHAFKCAKCNTTFSNAKLLSKHVSTHHKYLTQVSCTQCKQMFTTEDELNTHVTSEHRPLGFKCNLCMLTFPKNKLLLLHNELHHSPSSMPNNIMYCPKCSIGFQTQLDLNLHIDVCYRTQGSENMSEPVVSETLTETLYMNPQEFVQVKMETVENSEINSNFNAVNLVQPEMSSSFQDQFLSHVLPRINPEISNIHVLNPKTYESPVINLNIPEIIPVPEMSLLTPEEVDMSEIQDIPEVESSATDPLESPEIIDISQDIQVPLLKCPHCSEVFTNDAALRSHLLLDSGKNLLEYRITVNQTSFDRMKALIGKKKLRLADATYKAGMKKIINCVLCGFKYHFKCEGTKHNKMIHKSLFNGM